MKGSHKFFVWGMEVDDTTTHISGCPQGRGQKTEGGLDLYFGYILSSIEIDTRHSWSTLMIAFLTQASEPDLDKFLAHSTGQ